MYKLYDEYKDNLKLAKKVRGKRQKMNAEIRERYEEPFKRKDHKQNVVDITYWNQMISELETDMKEMEMYLDFEDRHYLHKEYFNAKSEILNYNSYEGEIPTEIVFGENIPDVTELLCIVELQNEIVELLEDVLTERQKKVVELFFWEGMTQDKIGRKMGLTQQGIAKILENALKTLRNNVNYDEIAEILRF